MLKILSEAAAQQVVRLQARNAHSPPSLVLGQVLEGCRGSEADANAQWLQPASAFGSILAKVYDRGMSPQEWARWSLPPAEEPMRYAVAVAWRSEVLAPFAAQFDLALVGDLPQKPHGLRNWVERRAEVPGAHQVDAWDLYWAGELLPDRPFCRVAEVIVRRPPGAGLYETWNLGRPSTNDPAWSPAYGSSSLCELPGRQHLPDGSS